MKFEEENNNAEVESSGTEEEEFGGGSIRPQIIAKRKRTKRRRLSTSGVVCNSVSSTDAGGDKTQNYESSVTTTATTTEEEEDMANCLILLARSGSRRLTFSNEDEVNFNKSLVKTVSESEIRKTISSSSSLIPTVVDGNVVYECKTCDKAFQSFQALGGHRASHHKKPKNIFSDDHTTAAATKVKPPTAKTSVIPSSSNLSYAVTHHLSAKVHECSICGSVFSSGQALGGHMRKHRTTTTTATVVVTATTAVDGDTELADNERYTKKLDDNENNMTNNKFLSSLDLNKPAPAEEEQDEDDDQMRHNQRTRLFAAASVQGSGNPSTTAPPLVGCYF